MLGEFPDNKPRQRHLFPAALPKLFRQPIHKESKSSSMTVDLLFVAPTEVIAEF